MGSTTGLARARIADGGHDVDDVIALLSRPGDRDLSEIVELVAHICEGDAAGITLRRGDEYAVPVTYGLDPFTCAAQDTFCRETMGTDGLFVVEDALADPRFATIGFVDGRLARARFYASAPVYAPGGEMVGRLCVIASEPRQLSPLQVRALETMGQNLTQLIELRLLRDRGIAAAATHHDSDTLLAQLSAELSHDLRVPLTSIMASVELVQEELGDSSDPLVASLLERCLAAADRMGRMLEQRMEALATPAAVDAGLIDLGLVARQVAADAASLAEPLRATIDVDDLPLVRADADDMYSVFQNLIGNSLKFARPGVSPRVLVTARRIPAGWRIAVLDNGLGIPPDRRLDVFSLFSRVHSGVEGHGIGLATVARVVTSHGGKVGAAESPGGGTEIWFDLPDSATV